MVTSKDFLGSLELRIPSGCWVLKIVKINIVYISLLLYTLNSLKQYDIKI